MRNSTVSSFIRSLPTAPKSCRSVRNVDEVSAFWPESLNDDSQNGVSVFLTLSVTSLTGSSGSWKRMHTPSKMSRMMSTGFLFALTSWMSLGLMDAIAALARSTNGCALERSASAAAFSPAMRVASSSHLLLILATWSPSFLASALETCSPSSILLVSSVATASFFSSSASTSFIASTSFAPWMSFSRPSETRDSFSESSASLVVYMVLYAWMNERYDLGVWKTARRIFSKYSSQTSVTILWTMPMCVMRLTLTSGVHFMSKLAMKPLDTETSASSGHGRNQSIVGPEMRPGKRRARSGNLGLSGDMQSMRCRLSRTQSVKYCLSASAVSGAPGRSLAYAGRRSAVMAMYSSLAKRPGTSPVMSTELMSSRKPSDLISDSVKRKTVCLRWWPALL